MIRHVLGDDLNLLIEGQEPSQSARNHLESCESCQELVERTRQSIDAMRDIEPASGAVRDRAIKTALKEFKGKPQTENVIWLKRSSTIQALLGAAAVLLAILIVIPIIQSSGKNEPLTLSKAGSAIGNEPDIADKGIASSPLQAKTTSTTVTNKYQEQGTVKSLDELSAVLSQSDSVSYSSASDDTPCLKEAAGNHPISDINAVVSVVWQPDQTGTQAYGFSLRGSDYSEVVVVAQADCSVLAHN